MPARLNTQTRVVQGDQAIVVGTDEGWRFGPVEGRWYIGMMIFAIVVLLYNLAWPWLYETATDRSWRFRHQVTIQSTVSPAPTVSQPPIVQQQAPPPTASPAPARELTPEERAEQYKEELRRQYGAR